MLLIVCRNELLLACLNILLRESISTSVGEERTVGPLELLRHFLRFEHTKSHCPVVGSPIEYFYSHCLDRFPPFLMYLGH